MKAIELGERRNCIVHADAKANKFYIDNCASRGVDVREVSTGTNLMPDDKYAGEAFRTCLVFGSMLFTSTWVKVCKKYDKNWDTVFDVLNDLAYDLMVDTRYKSSLCLLKFIHDDLFKLNPTDSSRRYIKINYALSLKKNGNQEEANKLLESEDWRSSNHAFQAAVAAIRGDTDEAISFIRTGYMSEQIPKLGLIEWPVFDHLRTLKKFRRIYDELVGKGAADEALVEEDRSKPVGPGIERIFREVAEWSGRSTDGNEKQKASSSSNTQASSPKSRASKAKPKSLEP